MPSRHQSWPWGIPAALVLAPWLALGLAPTRGHADDAASSLYIRTDTDHTTVVSPRARVGVDLDEATSADLAYSADVWTSASIDIRTAASKVVTEQRDELDATVSHDFGDVMLGGGYRFSYENDYESHALSGSLSIDLAENATTLATSGYVSKDVAGRSGDPSYARQLASFGVRAALTQIIDRQTLLQTSYDLASLDGYQASPYRFVGLDGPCVGLLAGPSCPPERTPNKRLRHALVLRGKRALSESVSAGLGYRLYFDDWSIRSHTLDAELAFVPDDQSTLTLRYRFYTQGGAEFYRAHYRSTDTDLRYLTSDRELSPMGLYRLGLDADHSFAIDDDTLLRLALSVGLTRYSYDDFPGLTDVTAYELSLALVVEL